MVVGVGVCAYPQRHLYVLRHRECLCTNVAEGVTPTVSPPPAPSTRVPDHATYQADQVVAWLRSACRLNSTQRVQSCGTARGMWLCEAGLGSLKVGTVLRVIQKGQWPPPV